MWIEPKFVTFAKTTGRPRAACERTKQNCYAYCRVRVILQTPRTVVTSKIDFSICAIYAVA